MKKQRGTSLGDLAGTLVAIIVTNVLRTSPRFVEFLYSLGIEDQIWHKILAIILAIVLGLTTMSILNKLIPAPAPENDNSYSLPIPMTDKRNRKKDYSD